MSLSVSLPAVGVNRAAFEHFALYYREKIRFADRGHHRDEDLPPSLKQPEDRNLVGELQSRTRPPRSRPKAPSLPCIAMTIYAPERYYNSGSRCCDLYRSDDPFSTLECPRKNASEFFRACTSITPFSSVTSYGFHSAMPV